MLGALPQALQAATPRGGVSASAPMKTSEIHSRLKAATAEMHARLEQQLNLLRDDLTLCDYVGLLQRFYGVYEPFERMADPMLKRLPGMEFERRKKTELLAADLLHLGASPEALALLPRLPFAVPEQPAQLLGWLYVLEGATLGGQILARRFATRFALSAECGLRFFTAYGEETATMWRRFLEVLAVHSQTEAAARLMVDSAVSMFARLLDWFVAGSYSLDLSAA
jgi:heme oxygenase